MGPAIMENIAHTLAGFALARAGLDRRTRLATTALVVGSNLPDVDAVAMLGGKAAYIDAHRGLTHSLAGGAVLAIAFGMLLYGLDHALLSRRKPAGERARLGPLVGLALLAVLGHLVFDALNDYGIRLLLPFSSRWYYGDIIFIVDPWFWLLLGGGLHLALRRGAIREAFAWTVWALASVPIMIDFSVPVLARVVWLMGLALLASLRLAGAVSHRRRARAGAVYPGPAVAEAGAARRPAADGAGDWIPRPQRSVAMSRSRGDRASAESPQEAQVRGTRPTRAALSALGLYCLAACGLHAAALGNARGIARALQAGAEGRRLALLPRPADPFDWHMIFENDHEIVVESVRSMGSPGLPASRTRRSESPPDPRRATPPGRPLFFEKNLDLPDVQGALAAPLGRTARRFCRYLFADLRQTPEGRAVAFRDARFAVRGRHEFSVFVVPVPKGRWPDGPAGVWSQGGDEPAAAVPLHGDENMVAWASFHGDEDSARGLPWARAVWPGLWQPAAPAQAAAAPAQAAAAPAQAATAPAQAATAPAQPGPRAEAHVESEILKELRVAVHEIGSALAALVHGLCGAA